MIFLHYCMCRKPSHHQHDGIKVMNFSSIPESTFFSHICVCVLVVHIVFCFSDFLFHLNTKQARDTFSIVLSQWHAILRFDFNAAFNYIHPRWFSTDSDFSQCFHQTSTYPWRKNFIQFHFLGIMKCIALPSLTNLDRKGKQQKNLHGFKGLKQMLWGWKFHMFRHIRLQNGSFFSTVRFLRVLDLFHFR